MQRLNAAKQDYLEQKAKGDPVPFWVERWFRVHFGGENSIS